MRISKVTFMAMLRRFNPETRFSIKEDPDSSEKFIEGTTLGVELKFPEVKQYYQGLKCGEVTFVCDDEHDLIIASNGQTFTYKYVKEVA